MPETFNFDPTKPLSPPTGGGSYTQSPTNSYQNWFAAPKPSNYDVFADFESLWKPGGVASQNKGFAPAPLKADPGPMASYGLNRDTIGINELFRRNPDFAAEVNALGTPLNQRDIWKLAGDRGIPMPYLVGGSGVSNQFVTQGTDPRIGGMTPDQLAFQKSYGALGTDLYGDVFDESDYLAANPDVAAKIGQVVGVDPQGRPIVLKSGRHHFDLFGRDENRTGGIVEQVLQQIENDPLPDPYSFVNNPARDRGWFESLFNDGGSSVNLPPGRFYNAAGDLDLTFRTGMDALMQAMGMAPENQPTGVPATQETPAGTAEIGSPEWSSAYLGMRPDVQAAIDAGLFPDALTHWNQYGQYEASGQPVPATANDPLTYGYKGGETNFFPPTTANDGAFDEQAYLANNPDVAAAVAAGAFPSGQAHWDQFGRYEPRFGGGEQKAAQGAATTPDGKPMRETTRVLLENLLRQTGGDPSLIEQAIPTLFSTAGKEIAGGAAGALADAAAMQAGDAASFGVDLASIPPVNPADLGVELAAAGGPSWIPNPITLIKFANMLVDYFTERPPEYTTTIRGADQATLDDLLQPVLNDMGDPVPVSEGLSHGAVKGDLRDEAGNPALTRWMLPDGTPNYDMSFLMNSQLPVAGGNMSDITALLLDEMLYQNDLRLNPNANLSLTTAVEPSRKGYAWTADFGDANPISTRDMNDFLSLLMTNLRDRNLVTAR